MRALWGVGGGQGKCGWESRGKRDDDGILFTGKLRVVISILAHHGKRLSLAFNR